MATVNQNMFGATITQPPGGAQLMVLPLNLIAEIVSHVRDTGDLARLCQTCRVLNYMALPQLYRSLTLTSYDKIRYRGEQPEGIGSASPFTMALNALVTRSYATLVQSITLRGEWKEHQLEEYARVGRVTDGSMLLNIAARAAIDRMPNLESFHWELNTKMLDTIYTGLIQLPKLTSLTIRFPSSRHPQPTFVIPGMPHLRCLKITDIDPLCYPDDIATLLCKSRKLRELKLHWSPRMREAHEPSVSLRDYFHKLIAAKQPLAVKKISFQNLYAFHTEGFDFAFDPTTVEDVTFLTGAEGSNLVNTFVESSWPTVLPHDKPRLKSIRVDAVSKRNSEFLGNFTGLERLYFVNVTAESSDLLNSPRPGGGAVLSALTPPVSEHQSSGAPNGTTTNSPITSASPATQPNAVANIRDIYLSHITTNHGTTLRHLLLPSKWPLSTGMVARLVHSCPNLEQLALATEFSSMVSLGLLIPFLRKLKALRLLIPQSPGQSPNGPGCSALKTWRPARDPKLFDTIKKVQEIFANAKTLAEVVDIDDLLLTEMLSYDLANEQVYGNVKIISIGWKAWELKEFYKAPMPEFQTPTNASPKTTTDSPIPTQGTNGVGLSAPDQPTVAPKSPDPQTKHISSWSRPLQSTLGKRSRDQDDSETPRPSPSCPPTFNMREDCEDPNAFYPGCYPYTLSEDGFVWRRRARRVGWEALQHWEVWALDAQEI
ncbi:hypothetical protein N7491_008895 [Penicillium cf. griseofulvum]|uniref:F-box domain-containing protein n=1 Tax=Penicillium cf. griseofulvum TaxID=2972120 RepID=A0A9W9MFM0_9EURO|nr:hypothetical protein N7472_005508 [Penicillium cf. griseofulvum]KAJ5423679.1 hypothetical protein N7491_008895 [Penicillium cf. griseofulvum]KAJ5431068.1 hypothetical protein N7445_008800 [Penicillium cf. griseofulvum]